MIKGRTWTKEDHLLWAIWVFQSLYIGIYVASASFTAHVRCQLSTSYAKSCYAKCSKGAEFAKETLEELEHVYRTSNSKL
jgi:hypothetical protein